MSWRTYAAWYVLALVILVGLASFLAAPGYMDAEYYYSMAVRIARDGTLSEPFIWNFLSEVEGIPHPGFSYWMPLTSLLAAGGMKLTGAHDFTAARVFLILLAGGIPPLTIGICYQLTGRRRSAILAGVLALFPPFYSIYLGTTDSFAVVMLLGGLLTILALKEDKSALDFFIFGAVSGLQHLARADGLIWVLIGILLAWVSGSQRGRAVSVLAAGYFLVLGPWFIRNLSVFGSILPQGASRMFWLLEYNELFNLHPEDLTFQRWASQGLLAALEKIARSLWSNLKTLILVQGQLILLPFIVAGAVRFRRKAAVILLLAACFAFFALMTIVFPFAGSRGGYLHSSASLQPLLWSLAAAGFFELIQVGVARRKWDPARSELVFGAMLVLAVVSSSAAIFYGRVIGGSGTDPVWDDSFQNAILVSRTLPEDARSERVMINNPPGLYAAAGYESVVIPNGPVDDLLEAAREYDVKYLVLEENHPGALESLYRSPGDETRLIHLATSAGAHYFEIP